MPADCIPTLQICEVRIMFISKALQGDRRWVALYFWAGVILLGTLLYALPAAAHHPTGGRVPATALQGFLSGLGHPVIGVDHLVFVIAVGLLSALKPRGIWIPVAFVLAAIAGTGLHLAGLDLPGTELWISASVLAFGLLLAIPNTVHPGFIVGLGAIAGLFHGYAYGEAIIGADMPALVAYLAGFTVIQLAIALAANRLAQRLLAALTDAPPSLNLRFAGFAICGAGAAFLSTVLLG
jgi:urease accessory protein